MLKRKKRIEWSVCLHDYAWVDIVTLLSRMSPDLEVHWQENCKDTAARWIHHKNGSTDDLPTELLHTILRFTLPPRTLLDPTPSRGAQSLWIRALVIKKGLSQVSKRWHSVLLPFMYEEVSFRHATQVRAFAASLRGNADLTSLVRMIVVDCPVTSEVRDVVIGDLAYILTRCSRLRVLIFTDNLFVMEDDLRSIALYPFPSTLAAAVETLSGTLRRFEQWPQGGGHHFTFPIRCITSCQQLTSLAINVDHPASLEPISFPSLEELDLSQEYDVRRAEHTGRFTTWELPSIKRLILPMATNIQGEILLKYGQSIDFLEFRDHLDMAPHLHPESSRHPYIELLHLCPTLRHLVFQVKTSHLSEFQLLNRFPAHPTLAYIDIWVTTPAGKMRREFLALRQARKLAPGVPWKNIRLLDRALNYIHTRRLPQLFPPDTPEDELPCTHSILGLAIVHAPWGVYRGDLDVLYPSFDSDSGEESDSEDTDDDSEATSSDRTFSTPRTVSDDTVTESEDEDGMDVDPAR